MSEPPEDCGIVKQSSGEITEWLLTALHNDWIQTRSALLLHWVSWSVSGSVFSSCLLCQGFIVRTDRSQSRSESSAGARPTHSSAGTSAGYRSPGSGNSAGETRRCRGNPSASCCRHLTGHWSCLGENRLFFSPATMKKRHHYDFITASQKENIILFRQLNVYRYHALFI